MGLAQTGFRGFGSVFGARDAEVGVTGCGSGSGCLGTSGAGGGTRRVRDLPLWRPVLLDDDELEDRLELSLRRLRFFSFRLFLCDFLISFCVFARPVVAVVAVAAVT